MRVQPEDGGSRRAGLTSEEERLLQEMLAQEESVLQSERGRMLDDLLVEWRGQIKATVTRNWRSCGNASVVAMR